MNASGPHFLVTDNGYPSAIAEIVTNTLTGCLVSIGVVAPASCNITITQEVEGMPDKVILDDVAFSDDAWIHPGATLQDEDGADIVGAWRSGVPVYGTLRIALDSSSPDETFTVTLQFE